MTTAMLTLSAMTLLCYVALGIALRKRNACAFAFSTASSETPAVAARGASETRSSRPSGFARTDVGKARKINEDRFLVDDSLGLYVVADGMGGHENGDMAAAFTVSTIEKVVCAHRQLIERARAGKANVQRVAELLEDAIHEANVEINWFAASSTRKSKMGSTVTALLLCGDRAVVVHVGDTRLYHLQESSLRLLTIDHNVENDLVFEYGVHPEKAARNPFAAQLTRAVGPQEKVRPDVSVVDVQAGDRFLLCSDGFSQYIPSHMWLEHQMTRHDHHEIPHRLTYFANNAGGSDNITAIAIELPAASTCPALRSAA